MGASRVEAVVDEALQAPVPVRASLELTYDCEWRCGICYNLRPSRRRNLDLREWTEVLEGLRSLGTLSVSLTGGDPLAHPEFLAIARRARSLGFIVKILTNGSLVTAEVAKSLKEIRVRDFDLSLHGASAATHDEATGRPGSFRQVWAAVRVLQEAGIRVSLKTPLTNRNAGEWERMASMAEDLGVPYVVDPLLVPRDDGDTRPLERAADAESIEQLFRHLAKEGLLRRRKKRIKGDLNCGIGWSGLAVGPEGDVYPCLQWRAGTLGSVRQRRIEAIWRHAPERNEVVAISRRVNDMLVELGGAVSERSFCPARAHLVTGDPLGLDGGFVREAMAAARILGTMAQENG